MLQDRQEVCHIADERLRLTYDGPEKMGLRDLSGEKLAELHHGPYCDPDQASQQEDERISYRSQRRR